MIQMARIGQVILALCVAAHSVSGDSYQVITYNTDLIHPDHYEERRSTLFDQLVTSSADVVCLQEVLSESDIREIVAITSEAYPYTWSFLHTVDGALAPQVTPPYNPCSYDTVVDFCVCVDTNCRDAADSRQSYFGCIFSACEPLVTYSPRCMECLVDACFTPTDLGATFSCMLQSAEPSEEYCQTFLDETHVTSTKGLLLLSKQPLENLQRGEILPTRSVMPVGYLSAQVAELGTLVCAHLTGFLGDPYMDVQTGFDSYGEENLFETLTLLGSFTDENTVVLGDFNFSPALPQLDISGQFAGSYDVMTQLGFYSTNVPLGQCTVCADNEMADYLVTRGGDNYIIDHILLRNSSSITASNVEVLPYGLQADMSSGDYPLSDHYAVQATLSN